MNHIRSWWIRIALEIQSNRRLILFDNAFADFTPDELMMVSINELF